MKDLKDIEKKALKALEEIGVTPNPYEINMKRFRGKFGMCTAQAAWGTSYIYMDPIFLNDDVDERFSVAILAHEMLHTCSEKVTGDTVKDHGPIFRERAENLAKIGIPAGVTLSRDVLKHSKKCFTFRCSCGQPMCYYHRKKTAYLDCVFCNQGYEVEKGIVKKEKSGEIMPTEKLFDD